MPRYDDLTARMAEPDFWPLYLFDDQAMNAYEETREVEGAEEEILQAKFLLDRGLGLTLEFEPGVDYVNLAVQSPKSAKDETVGWDDTAHFHPHVMPWSELDLLCRAAALYDPALRHPGPMLALLLRFAFLTEDDDLDAITPMVDAAFSAVLPTAANNAVPPGAAKVRTETRDWFDLRDLRGTGIEWTPRSDGCQAVTQHDPDGMPLYSLREPESAEFPFATWSEMLARATELLHSVRTDPALRLPEVRAALDRCAGPNGHRHIGPLASALSRAGFDNTALFRALSQPVAPVEAAWAIETLAGLELGELIAAWAGVSPLANSTSWQLSLTLPAAGRPWRFAQTFADELSTALQAAGLGRAETNGSTSVQGKDGGYVHHSDHLDILIRDDLPGGVRVISQLLHHHQAAETAVLKHNEKPYDRIAVIDLSA
ncbi:hypothetical protein KQY30_21420 [Streptomyces sp. GMY02]|uniref:hypothetical protein n=1 Tax=Streptomyces sp. GMY02 TaxID=1333528 RepID=UPI001C2B8FA7|nr:hypothetical protein [Streptomyces sp. GMY02]QXE36417.1 hypothetical protein KQY30_21420 [Streptomyces sp. GMY02]